MCEEVCINVGGSLFMTKWSTLRKYENTLLGSLSTDSEYYNHDRKYFFFDRNPEFFNTILDFYRNGHVHFPTNICGWIWKDELKFWQIPTTEISECCYPTYVKYDKDKALMDKLKRSFKVQTEEYRTTKVSRISKVQQKIWLFLDEPTSSVPARIFSILYLATVVLSAIIPVLITHPNIREKFVDLQDLIYWAEINGMNLWINTENPKEVQYITTTTPKWLIDLDFTVNIFFSLEAVLRFWACPKKTQFFKDWLNILDIILFLAMWTRYIIERQEEKMLESFDLMVFYSICFCVVVFRLLRFFRITKQYGGLRILLMAVRASLKELCLLIITSMVFALLFSNLIYFGELREPSTFPDMVVGLWWSIVTMTTVGYGDVVPKSALGRVVGSLCAMCGLLLLAMPIAVIAGKFNDLYEKNGDREDFNKLHQNQRKKKVNENTIQPIDSDSFYFQKGKSDKNSVEIVSFGNSSGNITDVTDIDTNDHI